MDLASWAADNVPSRRFLETILIGEDAPVQHCSGDSNRHEMLANVIPYIEASSPYFKDMTGREEIAVNTDHIEF